MVIIVVLILFPVSHHHLANLVSYSSMTWIRNEKNVNIKIIISGANDVKWRIVCVPNTR